jgi:hypothetical protein
MTGVNIIDFEARNGTWISKISKENEISRKGAI